MASTAPTTPAAPAASLVPAGPRGRWKRRLLLGAVALAVLLALAPFYLGPVLRRSLVRAIEERLDARASVQEVSFSWSGKVRVRGLALADEDGAALASLDQLSASVELLPLFSGEIRADVELAYPELHLARGADGRWNWERALARASAASREEAEDEQGGELPSVRSRLRIQDGHLVVHGALGDTTLSDVALQATVDGLDRPAPYELSLNVRGPAGPAGRIALAGSFTAASGGRIEPAGFAGEARLALEELDLAGFAPALALVAPVEGLGGIAAGRADLELRAGLALTGTTDVLLTDLALAGPRSPGAPVRIGRVQLAGRATQPAEGEGTQRLELSAESFLSLVYEGRSNLDASGAGSVAGTLTLSADLARLADVARAWVPIQEGVSVEGRVEHQLEIGLQLAAGRPSALQLTASGKLEGLAGRDEEGHALDLSGLETIAFELGASADLAGGTLYVPRLDLRAGPVALSGHLTAAGLPGGAEPRTLELGGGAFHVEADLERLRGTLGQVVDLTGTSFGGRLSADGTLRAEDGGLVLATSVDARGLSLLGTSLAELRGELEARRAADGTLAGSGTLHLGPLSLARAGADPLRLPGARASLSLQESAAGRGEHTLGLETDGGELELVVKAQSERRDGGELDLATTFELDGRIGPLAELARPLVPARPGLAGDLRVQGEVRSALRSGELASARAKLELAVTGLEVSDQRGKRLPLEAPARTTLALEGGLDLLQGRAELSALSLAADGLELEASGRAAGLSRPLAAGFPQIGDGRVRLALDLERLGAELARAFDLGGWGLGGSPLRAEANLATAQGRVQARGTLAADVLRLARPAAPPLEVAELGLDFDLDFDPAAGALDVRAAELRSRTATLALAGELERLSDPETARGKMRLELASELERILADLGLEGSDPGRKTSGKVSAKLALDGDRGAFRVSGTGAIEDFRLELAPAAAPSTGEERPPVTEPQPLVIEEPRIALACEASVDLAAIDVELERLTLDSTLARGGLRGRVMNLRGLGREELRFEGLAGELAYVPDRLGAVLAPWLPGKLSGAEEQRVTFALDGRARELDVATLLGSEARVDLGLGRFERPEFQLGGGLSLEAKGGKALVRGDLAANGGTLRLDGMLDLAGGDDGPRSRLTVAARDLRANSGLAPLLALLHPAFGGTSLARGELGGVIGLDLDLAYDGPLTLEALQAGWKTLPKEPINGSGRLELSGATLRGSPFLALLEPFGVDTHEALDVRPIEFTVKKGRVSYARPWTWTLSGTETTFSGSVGLDQSLDLAWNVPISDRLVQRWSFLSSLKGESLSIPLRGSVLVPRLEADELLKDLAAKAARSALEGRLGLGDASGDDPAALLEQADALWSKGKKTEAAAIYVRLRDEFKLSLTYALNKDRIKDRSKYKEPPR